MTRLVVSQRWKIRLAIFGVLFGMLFILRLRTMQRSLHVRSIVSNSSVTSAVLTQSAPVSLVQIHTDWHKAVETTLAVYVQDHAALRARDALLALTVAPVDQEVHLKLVLALTAVSENASDANKKWQAAERAFLQQPVFK